MFSLNNFFACGQAVPEASLGGLRPAGHKNCFKQERDLNETTGGLEYDTEWTIACEQGFLSILIPNFV